MVEKKKVIVTGIIPIEGLHELKEVFDVTYSEEAFSREFVLENLHKYEGILLMGLQGDRELIDAGTNLKIIAVNAVGFDHVDIAYAKEKGIVVANAPSGVQVPTAEMTVALILAATKRLSYYDKLIRRGEWVDVSERQEMGLALEKSVLGIFGMGRIGKRVAKLAQAFGLEVIYNDPYQLSEADEEQLKARFVSFEELLESADIISIHAPLLESTKHLFNREAFEKMKKTSYLINAARGPIVQDSALIDALKTNKIAGAGLDVFESEPNVSKDYFDLENVIMSPHAATGTLRGRTAIAHEAAANIISYLAQGIETNRVNK